MYYGDNLDVLRQHIKDDSVDLIYLDPPFNSNRLSVRPRARMKQHVVGPVFAVKVGVLDAVEDLDRVGADTHVDPTSDVSEPRSRIPRPSRCASEWTAAAVTRHGNGHSRRVCYFYRLSIQSCTRRSCVSPPYVLTESKPLQVSAHAVPCALTP